MLPVLDPRAAAVDVGSEQMFVSVAGDAPKVFGTCTADIRELVAWLQARKVSSVAMEATGAYWMCLYEELESTGVRAIVVNVRHVKNLPGRKTDWSDCQWLARLNCMGLLRGGFVPPDTMRVRREYQRLRTDHVRSLTTQVQLMHKALERMNIKVQDVLSSLSTASGLRTVRGIVAGVRDAPQLAALCDAQVRKRKREALIKSLEARWHEQHLFALGQALAAHDFYQGQITPCDQCIGRELARLPVAPPPPSDEGPAPGPQDPLPSTPKEIRHNAPRSIGKLHEELVRLYGGMDLSRLPAMSDYTVLQLLSEIGTDMSAWPSEKHFTAWLGLAPGSHQSGKRQGNARRYGGQAGRIFRVAARALARAKNSWLGAFYRRIRATRGGLVANKAAARKMAELFYRCVTKGWQYTEQGLAKYEEHYKSAAHSRAEQKGFAAWPASHPQHPDPMSWPPSSSHLLSQIVARPFFFKPANMAVLQARSARLAAGSLPATPSPSLVESSHVGCYENEPLQRSILPSLPLPIPHLSSTPHSLPSAMPRPQPAIIFIFITLFLDIFGIGVIVPVLPKLVERLQGGDVQAAAHSVGWLGALYAIMQFIFSPVLGALSDRFGRRPVILTSLFGSGIDYLVLAWAPTIGWLYLARVVSGITAANFTAASAYIADVTPPEKRAAGFGMIGAAFGLGFIAGPAVGGMLGTCGLRVPFLVAAAITLLNWLYGAFVLPESLSKENRRPFHWASAHPIKALTALSRWPLVMGLAGTHFLSILAGNIYPCLWVLYTGTRYGWDSGQVGMSLALVGVMASIVQAGLAGRIISVIGERKGVYLGLTAMAVAMFLYGSATAGWMVYGIIIIGSLGGIGSPATQSMISQAVPPDEQGAVQGALNSITSIAGIVAPLLWTQLFSIAIAPGNKMNLPGLPFFGAALVSLLAAGLAWRAFQRAELTKA